MKYKAYETTRGYVSGKSIERWVMIGVKVINAETGKIVKRLKFPFDTNLPKDYFDEKGDLIYEKTFHEEAYEIKARTIEAIGCAEDDLKYYALNDRTYIEY